ncbi:DUF397 domain-containing protein [Streptomyces sp. DSM 44917]|uniref:DUF397 domain-containing protein n=1 Tax=Streptomyces boetiae TaxID=3075541 RepID=A0ABU2L6N2_9ACTN|nr:DUF397 domain-containing protein [Streptomyces sp. DSM 44917]MDT0306908.1 DUF397 domain-containing protein [Streptomyces sp. DSM 44917]
MTAKPQPDRSGLEWITSSYSGTNGDCVQVAALPTGGRAVRDSKRPGGSALSVSPVGWHAFTRAIGDGALDASWPKGVAG